jgi:hypothetical protein
MTMATALTCYEITLSIHSFAAGTIRTAKRSLQIDQTAPYADQPSWSRHRAQPDGQLRTVSNLSGNPPTWGLKKADLKTR